MLLTSAVISGLGLGSMYGLIALGFHVTYVVSNTVNFSQLSGVIVSHVSLCLIRTSPGRGSRDPPSLRQI